MRLGRLIALLVLAVVALWLWKNRSALTSKNPPSPRDSQLSEAAREAEKSSATGVSENMTPDQVRSVLGSPDEVESYTTESGKPGERWTYRQVHRMVVFENGIAVSVQPI